MMHFRFSTLAGLAACLLAASCTSVKLRNADAYYEEYAFADAIRNYEAVLSRKIVPEAMERLADCYRLTGNSEKALFWYGQVVKSEEAGPLARYHYAEALMENGRYGDARTWFGRYLEIMHGDERARRLMRSCDSVAAFFSDSSRYAIEALPLNAEGTNNFSPAYYRTGIVFVSDRGEGGRQRRSNYTGNNYLDLFYARKTELGNWLDPEPLRGKLNGAFNEGPAVFTNEFNTVYFTRNDYTGRTPSKNKRSFNNLKIMKGNFSGGEWTISADLPFNNPDYSTAHPALTAKGDVLYFISDMPWGYGGTDIYKVEYRNGQWGTAQNLGSTINTSGNELFPFVHRDTVLYFASDGNYGLGGLDIFQSIQVNGAWSEPFNLGYPINSSRDDFGMIVDAEDRSGYFSSKRAGNTDRIYAFTKRPALITVGGTVTDLSDNKPMDGVSVLLAGGSRDTTAVTGPDGIFLFPLQRDRDYRLEARRQGYYMAGTVLHTGGLFRSTALARKLALRRIKSGEVFRYYDIRFEPKGAALDSSSFARLDSLTSWLTDNPGLNIEVGCHTDSRGNDRANLVLTGKRAEEIADYFSLRGVHPRRVRAVGYGETKLLNNCVNGILCLDEDHRVNERVEITVLSSQ